MSAKEMFEKLGYKVREVGEVLTISSMYNDIIFLPNSKSIMLYNGDTVYVSLDELKAINKQVEELGWKGEKQ